MLNVQEIIQKITTDEPHNKLRKQARKGYKIRREMDESPPYLSRDIKPIIIWLFEVSKCLCMDKVDAW